MELTQEEVENFQVPGCPKCGGILKPYVVFFGDNVPRGRVEEARREVSKSDKLLGKRYIKTVSEEFNNSEYEISPLQLLEQVFTSSRPSDL